MAYCSFISALLISSSLASECTQQERAIGGVDEQDSALSLLQASARKVRSAPVAAKSASIATAAESVSKATEQVAIVNMIRHGEKCVNSGEYLLDPVGFDRAKYLKHCMSNPKPTPALPFGPPTHALAGSGLDSWRPFITILPLAEKLNITLDLPCASPMGFKCIAEHVVKHLHDRATLLVADVYQFIPYVTAQFNLPIPLDDYNTWPWKCPSSTKSFVEPHCCATDLNYNEGNNASFPFEPASICFDQIWQVTFTRPGEGTEWKAKGLKKFNEGFGGNPDGPCLQGLKPY